MIFVGIHPVAAPFRSRSETYLDAMRALDIGVRPLLQSFELVLGEVSITGHGVHDFAKIIRSPVRSLVNLTLRLGINTGKPLPFSYHFRSYRSSGILWTVH